MLKNACADANKSGTVFLQRMLNYVLAITPSSLIAICGSSDLYYRAISFAGEIPCLYYMASSQHCVIQGCVFIALIRVQLISLLTSYLLLLAYLF